MFQQTIKSALIPNDRSEEVGEDYIYAIDGYQFDADQMWQDFQSMTKAADIDTRFTMQLNLRCRQKSIDKGMSNKDLFFDFSGSLAPFKNGGTFVEEKEFTVLHPLVKGTYTETVINQIINEYPDITTLGRIRWMWMCPKTVYSMHKDPDWYRLHIPVQRNKNSFFICEQKYFEMPDLGRLYVIHPQCVHTAINSDLKDTRLHLLFDSPEDFKSLY